MGSKERVFSPLPRDLSLEDLVPEDHFYRRLEAECDLFEEDASEHEKKGAEDPQDTA